MGPEGIILVNPSITTLQQSLTHSAVGVVMETSHFINYDKCGFVNYQG